MYALCASNRPDIFLANSFVRAIEMQLAANNHYYDKLKAPQSNATSRFNKTNRTTANKMNPMQAIEKRSN